jgi:DnaJ-class molecular chaperone
MESNEGKKAVLRIPCPECKTKGIVEITSGKFAGRLTKCEECAGEGYIYTNQGPEPEPSQEKLETST